MSNLFSLVKESSIPKDIFSSSYSRENYIITSAEVLESMNEIVENNTKKLYKAIAEANNASEENRAIQDFVGSIRGQLTKLSLDLQQMQSRFVISLTNYCDTVNDQINNITISDSSIGYDDNRYVSYNKASMLNPSCPKMNPHSIFEREFNFIAQLMQELPITASNKDKLNVVATVCDKFSGVMKDSTYKKLYADIFNDSESTDTKFSSYISSLFRGNISSKRIGMDDYEEAVECIHSCDEFANSINEMNSKLISDLNGIISDLNNIFSCGERNKFKVDTKEDGIKNTIYSVDVYTSNKIMWLAQEKVNEIVNIYNKYILAMSIKLECILAYVKQSANIINSFAYLFSKNTSETIDTDSDDSDDETELDSEEENQDENDTDIEDGNLSTEDDIDDDLSSSEETNDEPIDDEEDTEADSLNDDSDNENESTTPDFDSISDTDLEEAVAEFYIEMHECSEIMHRLNVLESAGLLALNEDGEQGDQNKSQDAQQKPESDKMANVKKFVGKVAEQKKSIWQRIVQAIVNMWNKFHGKFKSITELQIKYLADNEKYIAMDKIDRDFGDRPMQKYEYENISKIRIPDLNYDKLKDELTSDLDFISKNDLLKQFAPDPKKKQEQKVEVFTQNIIESIIAPGSEIHNANEIEPQVIYNNFCKSYKSVHNEIEEMTKIIDKGMKNADAISKSVTTNQESSIIDNDIMRYFNEESFTPPKDDGKTTEAEKENADGKKDNDVSDKLAVYFRVCGKVMAAKQTVCQRTFNDYYAYLKWHIGEKKKAFDNKQGGDKKDNGGEANNQTAQFNH